MTWSARSSSDGGIVRPRALAVLRLTTNRNRSACSTGRSAGSSPFRTFLKKDGSLQLRTVGVEVQCRARLPRRPAAGGGGLASFGGIIHRLYSLLVDDKTAEAPEEFARQQGFRRIEDVDAYRRFAGGSGDSAEVTGTSALSSPMCPRRGSKVLGSRFRFAAPLPVAA
jgi:hypothetical protein